MRGVDILVADDEAHVVRALSFVFKKEGFQVETAADGEEALAKYREFSPRVVFIDLVMPRMDGLTLCRRIRSPGEQRRPYVIILTSKGQDLDRKNCIEAGADDFISKPFSPKEVIAKVKAIITNQP